MSDIAAPPRRSASLAPPTRLGALAFAAKSALFRLERLAKDTVSGPARLARGGDDGDAVAGYSRTPLWGDTRAAERAMQWGKVHNLRVAARALDGTIVPQGCVFSFWREMGAPTRARGFVDGRMLREGCLVPSAGGGLCQLSNALYDVALQAGCEIVERHAHSRIVPGSAAAQGRDATVAWNYVDLRFRAPRRLVLRVMVERDALDVKLVGVDAFAAPDVTFVPAHEAAETCGTCAETSCFRHEGHRSAPTGRTAFLMDEDWPEFRAYIASTRKDDDPLFAAHDTTLAAMLRGLSQRAAKTAPQRRAAELAGSARIARRLACHLTPDVTEICVAQSLLPHLWRLGHLGGRQFSVLMTRLPMAEIQSRLDAASRAHPERKSLADFRADPALVAAESAALAAADTIVTPHTETARLFGTRALLLDWHMPPAAPRAVAIIRDRIAFPGPTLARKGAYELRDAARALDLEVALCGNELEGADFWSGVHTLRSNNWLNGVTCVVQPAFLEDAPRRLLQALAAGVPVIATRACGLPEQPGVTFVPEGDVAALVAALKTGRHTE
ncbi:MAG TPA: VanW family protein [Rhizomicrobium sp.]